MCPGKSINSVHQTNEQLNSMNGNEPFLDGAQALSNEQTALYKDIAEMSLNIESVMERDDSQQVCSGESILSTMSFSEGNVAMSAQSNRPLHSQAHIGLPGPGTSINITDLVPQNPIEMSDSSGEDFPSADNATTSGISGSDPEFSEECQEALGMENGLIFDRQISASSEWSAATAANQGRLHFKPSGTKSGGWSAVTNDVNQWLQVDLGSQHFRVTHVATQGSNGIAHWVTVYKLQYSNNGVNFQFYREQGQSIDKEFAGNIDQDTVVTRQLNPPITARYIRFLPVTWYNWISMRVELYGHLQENLPPFPQTHGDQLINYEAVANPNRCHIKGGQPCCFKIDPKLIRGVTSGYAFFAHLGKVRLQLLDDGWLHCFFPPSKGPGTIPVMLQSQDGKYLGHTEVEYYDDPLEALLHQIVVDENLQQRLFEMYGTCYSMGGDPGTTRSDTHYFGSLGTGFLHPVQMLCLLVWEAAKVGAQQFIEMIFNSSAGRVVFNAYKDKPVLPEVIAKNHGNERTANYLEDVTKRFLEEIRTGEECPKVIDWSELAKAAESAQKQHNITRQEENYEIERDVPKETGYLGDIDTSSSESSELQSSDSEDDIPTTAKKGFIGQKGDFEFEEKDLMEDRNGETKEQCEVGNKPLTETEAEKWKQPDEVPEDTIKANKASLSQTLISFFKDGNFQEKQVIVKIKPLNWEQNPLHLIKDHLVQEAHSLRHLKCLYRSGISFVLGLGQEPVQLHLITTHEKLGMLLKLTKERNTNCKMHTNTAEVRQSRENSSTMVGHNDDYTLSSMDSLLQLYCRPLNFDKDSFEGHEIHKDCLPEFATTPNDEYLIERTNLPKFLTEHCYFTDHDVWMLTYAFRPRRKILFVYVADKQDVFPRESPFHNGDYELSTQCWQWKQCQNKISKVRKRLKDKHKLSELKKSQLDPPPLTPHVTLITEVACKEQSHPVDGQPYDLVGQTHDLVGKQCSKYFFPDHTLKLVKRNYINPPGDLTSHKYKDVPDVNNEIDELLCFFATQKFYDVCPSIEDNDDEVDHTSICQNIDACYALNTEMHHSKKKCDFEDVSTNQKDDHDGKTIMKVLDEELSYDLRSSWQPKKGSQVTKTLNVPYREDSTVLSVNECCDDLNKGAKKETTEHQELEDQRSDVDDGLAENMSSTFRTVTIDYVNKRREDLSEILMTCKSLAALNLTIDLEDWAKGLDDGLAKITSLTTLNLTIDDNSDCGMSGNWTKDLGGGLAKDTSLTTLNLTINNSSDHGMSRNWTKGLGGGLAKNTSLTTLNLTINNSSDHGMSGNWTKGLGGGLAKNTSLTTLNLTINNSSDHGMSGNWTKGLGGGLAKNTSLTTLNLTINNSSDCGMSGSWTKGLRDGLAKNTSLTTLNLTINNSSDHGMSGNWTAGLVYGLAENTSLTTLTLTINDSSDHGMSGNLIAGLVYGLAENTSLTTLNLTINNSSDHGMSGDWTKGLGDGLAKNTSLTTLNLTINDSSSFGMHGDWTEGLGYGLAKNTSLTSFTLNNQHQQLPWNESERVMERV
ncbi:uncharacterized protein LOC144638724 isoform X2 [Oculina patagonica]